MIDHLGLQCRDPERSAAFYTTVFAPLGVVEGVRFPSPDGLVVGLAGRDGAWQLWVSGLVDDGVRPVHLALSAGSREEVEAVQALARQEGAEILHEAREFPEYHPGYYGVFLRDPDGNNVEAVFHGAPEGASA
ncbi:VOC family protein [Motilibacter rhizosphaerae]|nr:VOC family protein [Motilibacter rhizosphaerae]